MSEQERKRIPNTDNYLQPCQVEVFWLEEPEFQSIIISNFPDRPDLEIIVNGPFKGYEFVEKVDKVLEESRWNRPAAANSPYVVASRRDTIADLMYGIMFAQIRQISASLFTNIQRPMPLGGQMLTSQSWVSLFAGNIAQTDQKGTIEKMFASLKAQAAAAALQPTPNIQPPTSLVPFNEIQATVAFVYPPITVGKLPEPHSLGDYVRGFPFFDLMKKALECKLGNERIVFTKDGLMAITTSNKHLAIRTFNVISAVMLLEGIPAQVVRESEAGQGSFDSATLDLRSWGWAGTGPRATLAQQRMFERSWFQYGRTPVEEQKLSKIVETADRIMKHPNLADELILWLEASTHFQDSEYAQSFIVSWIIVERNLSNIWAFFLSERNVRGDRENKLTDSNRWPIDSVLETLNVANFLPEREYKSLMELKSKRNSYVHRGRKITKEDSEECLKLATEIMKHDLEGLLELN